jgi:hypothetical protein
MNVLVLNLPLPPSVNALFANVPGKGRVRTKAYRRWSIAALNYAWLSKPQGGFPRFDGAFDIQITVPLKMRGDVDGRLKPVLDFLQSPLRVIAEDKHCQKATIARGEDVEPGFCRIYVFETPSPAPARTV